MNQKRIGWIAAAVVAALIVVLVLLYANLARIAQGIIERQVPGLRFQALDVGWNRVSLSGVRYTLPSGKVVLSAKEVEVTPSLSSLFGEVFKVASVEIESPEVYIERRRDGSVVLPVPQPVAGEGAAAGEPAQAGTGEEVFKLYLGKVAIHDGRGEFVDHSVGRPPARFKIRDVEIEIEHIHVPAQAGHLDVALSMKLAGARTGEVEIKGWLDPVAESGKLEFEAQNVYMPLAEPYYRSRNTTARLQDGRLDVDLEIRIERKDVVVPGEVKISQIRFAGRSGRFFGIPVDQVAAYVEDKDLPAIPFEVQGSLDRPDQIRVAVLRKIAERLAQTLGVKAVEQEITKKLLGDDAGGGKARQLEQLKGLFKRE